METSPIQRSVRAADLPLERLAANSTIPQGEKIDAACRAFEAILLRQILGEATKPVIPSTFNQDSSVNSIYRDLVTEQMADGISRTGHFGLARSFMTQLGQRSSAGEGPKSASASPSKSAEPSPKDGHRNPLLDAVPNLFHRPTDSKAPLHE